MPLEAQINQDLTQALKTQDQVRLATLRMLKSALQHAAIERHPNPLTDADVLAVIGRQIKQRREAIEAYRRGGRAELAAKEEAELAILAHYAPPPVSDQELRALVAEAVAAVGASGPADQGKVMKQLMGQLQGRADGRRVSQLVTERLGRRA